MGNEPSGTPTQSNEPPWTPTQPNEPRWTPTQPNEPRWTPTQPNEPSQPDESRSSPHNQMNPPQGPLNPQGHLSQMNAQNSLNPLNTAPIPGQMPDTDFRLPPLRPEFNDVDLRGNPNNQQSVFKSAPVLPATEIKAGYDSHPQMEYNLTLIRGLSKPDYSQVRLTMAPSMIVMDPRLGPRKDAAAQILSASASLPPSLTTANIPVPNIPAEILVDPRTRRNNFGDVRAITGPGPQALWQPPPQELNPMLAAQFMQTTFGNFPNDFAQRPLHPQQQQPRFPSAPVSSWKRYNQQQLGNLTHPNNQTPVVPPTKARIELSQISNFAGEGMSKSAYLGGASGAQFNNATKRTPEEYNIAEDEIVVEDKVVYDWNHQGRSAIVKNIRVIKSIAFPPPVWSRVANGNSGICYDGKNSDIEQQTKARITPVILDYNHGNAAAEQDTKIIEEYTIPETANVSSHRNCGETSGKIASGGTSDKIAITSKKTAPPEPDRSTKLTPSSYFNLQFRKGKGGVLPNSFSEIAAKKSLFRWLNVAAVKKIADNMNHLKPPEKKRTEIKLQEDGKSAAAVRILGNDDLQLPEDKDVQGKSEDSVTHAEIPESGEEDSLTSGSVQLQEEKNPRVEEDVSKPIPVDQVSLDSFQEAFVENSNPEIEEMSKISAEFSKMDISNGCAYFDDPAEDNRQPDADDVSDSELEMDLGLSNINNEQETPKNPDGDSQLVQQYNSRDVEMETLLTPQQSSSSESVDPVLPPPPPMSASPASPQFSSPEINFPSEPVSTVGNDDLKLPEDKDVQDKNDDSVTQAEIPRSGKEDSLTSGSVQLQEEKNSRVEDVSKRIPVDQVSLDSFQGAFVKNSNPEFEDMSKISAESPKMDESADKCDTTPDSPPSDQQTARKSPKQVASPTLEDTPDVPTSTPALKDKDLEEFSEEEKDYVPIENKNSKLLKKLEEVDPEDLEDGEIADEQEEIEEFSELESKLLKKLEEFDPEDLEDGEIVDEEEEIEEFSEEESKLLKKLEEVDPEDLEDGEMVDEEEEIEDLPKKPEKDNKKKRRHSDEDKEKEKEKSSKKKRRSLEDELEQDFVFVRGASPPKVFETEIISDFRFPEEEEFGDDRRRRKSSHRGSGRRREEPAPPPPSSRRPRRPVKDDKKSDVICAYFMQGKCQKSSDDCSFSQDAVPPRKMELCKLWMMKCCVNKDKCMYLHNDFPCKYYHTGLVCKMGERCKFSHNPLLSEVTKSVLLKHIETAPKEILGDFPRLNRSWALNLINQMESKINGTMEQERIKSERERDDHPRRNRWEQPTRDDYEKLHELMEEAGISGFYKDTLDDSPEYQMSPPHGLRNQNLHHQMSHQRPHNQMNVALVKEMADSMKHLKPPERKRTEKEEKNPRVEDVSKPIPVDKVSLDSFQESFVKNSTPEIEGMSKISAESPKMDESTDKCETTPESPPSDQQTARKSPKQVSSSTPEEVDPEDLEVRDTADEEEEIEELPKKPEKPKKEKKKPSKEKKKPSKEKKKPSKEKKKPSKEKEKEKKKKQNKKLYFHKCTTCGKAFTEMRSLKCHEKTHTLVKKFKCKTCNSLWRTNYLLTVHERIHTGEKPFGCNNCEKSFTKKCDLQRHERTHSGEKPFNCGLCKKSCNQKTSLYRHIKTLHTKESF